MSIITKTIYSIIGVVLVAALAIGGYTVISMKGFWDNPSQLADRPLGQVSSKFNKGVVNLVLLGIDSNEVRDSAHLGYRTDTIVVCAIDTVKKTVKCVTVPRDTRVKVKKLDAATGAVKSSEMNKINASMALGSGRNEYGYKNTLDSLVTLFSTAEYIPMDCYAAIDMDGIAPIADAVGGVPVTLDVTIGGVGKKGETVALKGEAAMAYIRSRKDMPTLDGSDLSRAKRQQAFFLGLAKRIKEMGPMTAVPKLWGELQQYVTTDLDLNQMVGFASVLNDVDIANVPFEFIPGVPKTISGASYYVPDEAGVRQLVDKVWH